MGAAMRSSRWSTHRSVRIALAFGLLLALALSATTASAAPNTSTTVVVTGTDISSGTGTVSDTGWFTGDTRSGGTVSLVTGPSPTPLGTGSLQLNTTDANGPTNAKAQLFNYSYIGTRLSDITALSYSDYHATSTPEDPDQRASINIKVDYLGDGSSSATFVFEPYRQPGATLAYDTWQHWDAITSGEWWSSTAITTPGSPLPTRQSTQASWSQIIAAFPNAKIVGGIGFNIGSGWVGIANTNADALTIGVNGSTTTYDFEKTPPLFCRVLLWTNQNQPCSFTNSSWISNFFRGLSGSGWPFRGGFR